MSTAPWERDAPDRADPSLRDPTELTAELGVDPAVGLSETEARRRLERDGPNELAARDAVPLWRRIVAQFADPLVALLLVAAAVSALAWIVEGASGAPVDAIVIVAIVVVNAGIGLVQEAKADDAVASLRDLTAPAATVLRDGRPTTVRAADVVRGDILVLAEGDAVAADARLVEASALRVAEASLTGESVPVDKSTATLPAPAPLGDRVNLVFRGTAVVQGVGRAVVTGTGMDTELGAIADLLEATPEEPTPLQREVARIGRRLGIGVVAIAIVVMATLTAVSGARGIDELVVILLLGVSLAVAAVPEGLPTVLSLVLAIGVQRMARRNAVVKRLSSAESLGSASVICTDKTGTLTRNEMTVQRVVTASGAVEITGLGYAPEGTVRPVEHPGGGDADTPSLHESGEFGDDQRHETRLALGVGSLANDAHVAQEEGRWRAHGDPTEAAILVAARKLEGTLDDLERFERRAEIPFDSERKMMSTLHRDPDGRTLLFSKGAPDVLLEACTALQVGRDTVELTPARRERALADIEALSSAAYRTLGVAYRDAGEHDLEHPDRSVEHDLVYVGVLGIVDPPRAEAADAIAQAHRAGVRVVMITGDHPTTAARIAEQLGIVAPGGRAMSGTELDGLDETELRRAVREVSVYARVSPQHKLRLVDALQADGRVVAMTGDGVNDAPALKSADIGIAMGITGTEVTKDAARMILADDDFATIVAAIRQGRVIFDDIRKFLRYLLSSNLGEVLAVFLGVVFAGALGLADAEPGVVVLPLLATQILWINLVTDSGPALAMGVDPPVDDVMARPPRRPEDPAIDGRMWSTIVTTGIAMALATLLAIDVLLPGGLVEGDASLEVARTAGFTTLVLAQLGNAFAARSERASLLHGMFSNGWLWAAVLLGLVLQIAVVTVPFLQAAFGTAPLTLGQWLVCAALAAGVVVVVELRKLLRRAIARRHD